MCGIVGLVTIAKNGPSTEELRTFRDMLVFGSVRGFDSTGVFGVQNNGNVDIVKAAMTGAEFVTTHDYTTWSGDMLMRGQFLVGHNRAATRGTVNDKNAHPFWKDDKIILVQNGTFVGGHKHIADTEVDTEAITHLLARESDVEKALQQVDAAYALVWYNVEEKTLNIIRNTERPLYFAYTSEGSCLFASEPNFIMCAAYRNGVKLDKPPYMLKEFNLVQFKLDDDAQNGVWSSDYFAGDYKFKSKYDQSYENWRNAFRNRDLNDDAFDTDPVGNVQELNSWRASPSASLLEVEGFAKEVALNDYFPMSEAESANELAVCNSRPRGKPALIELIDYMPGNTHPNCNCWWVCGSKVGADVNSPSPIFYSIIINKTEEQIKAMTDCGFYWATTASAFKFKIGTQNDSPLYVVTNYVTALEQADEQITTSKPH